jgi:hypothetical protein
MVRRKPAETVRIDDRAQATEDLAYRLGDEPSGLGFVVIRHSTPNGTTSERS